MVKKKVNDVWMMRNVSERLFIKSLLIVDVQKVHIEKTPRKKNTVIVDVSTIYDILLTHDVLSWLKDFPSHQLMILMFQKHFHVKI